MKKKISLIVLVCILMMIWIVIIFYQNRTTWLDMDEDGIFVSLKSDNREEVLRPWFDEENDVYYFFLPAYADDQNVYVNKSVNSLKIDDKIVASGHKFTWQTDREYRIDVGDVSYSVRFMKSENLPAFFLDTESGDMEYIHADKENKETGKLAVINADGHLQYTGILDKISGRGNSTWWHYKKPYAFTLQKEAALCGLESGKKWNLLALGYDHDKIHTKICLDMAREMGIEYTPESTWIDLYCNGRYAGLYLLTEAVTVGEGRVEIHDLEQENKKVNSEDFLENIKKIQNNDRHGYDILSAPDSTGGYLIERDTLERYTDDKAYFVTSSGYFFSIKSPKHASLEQVNYIADFVQNIENMLQNGNTEYRNYIDMESFARKFLLDKIVMEADAMGLSAFFYKEKNSDLLYAGPAWDYDRSMGERLPNYEENITEKPFGMEVWYMTLCQDEEFNDILVSNYLKMLPYLEKVLTNDIDYYINWISASMAMENIMYSELAQDDTLRKRNSTLSYIAYDSYVKYLKYFLANRLNYLNSVWGISDIDFQVPPSTGEYHKVVFTDKSGNYIETQTILDGEGVKNFPLLNQEYVGWHMNGTPKKYDEKIPIYEDTVLEAYN